MANSAQSEKRARQAEKRRTRGQMLRTRFRTQVKRARAALANGDAEAAKTAFAAMQESADKTASKGVIHRNAAARIKSRLSRQLKTMKQPEPATPEKPEKPSATAAKAPPEKTATAESPPKENPGK